MASRTCVLKVVATIKISIFGDLASIEEIGYFTFLNNSDGVPPNEALPNFIIVFEDVACDKHEAIREYFVMSDTRTSTASICVKRMQRYQSISYTIMQIC